MKLLFLAHTTKFSKQAIHDFMLLTFMQFDLTY